MEADGRKIITITVTQSCNLRCSYCYEYNKSNRNIDIDMAKKIIDYEFKHLGKYTSLEFDLFGGEPFVAFREIKEITEYICKNKGDIPCIIFVITNGTLVHGEIQEWLRKHDGCFVCGLSLDGTREMHNINRCGSYDDIDLDFFLEMYPEQEVKMTISRETLPCLADGVIDMQKKGFLVSCNLAYQINWSDQENKYILDRELHKLIDFYLQNPEYEVCSMLGMGIETVGIDPDNAIRYCGAGIDMRVYDVDGKYYPCQFFMPLSVGEEKAAKAKDIQFPENVLPQELLDEKCRECVVRSICPNCYGANYAATGNIYHRDENMCTLTKIILKARSYFLAKKWEAGMLETDSDQETEVLLKAILKIQKELVI